MVITSTRCGSDSRIGMRQTTCGRSASRQTRDNTRIANEVTFISTPCMSHTKYNIGIMQGRLVPPVDGKIQAFPTRDWGKEILLAREAGFDGIEWIFDGEENPILSEEGQSRMKKHLRAHDIKIPSVSGDYLMYHPIFGATKAKSVAVLKKLIEACAHAHIPRINVPLEDQSGLNSAADVLDAIASLRQCLPLAEKHHIILATESSLAPENLLALMEKVNHPNFKINYDLGNSRAFGFPTDAALRLLAPYLAGIHIKDRTRLFGPTVPLGTGEVDFATHFRTLRESGYTGWLVIQGARGENDFETAKTYLNFVRHLL